MASMINRCSRCGHLAYGMWFPRSARDANKTWTTHDYDTYIGPVFCSETCRDEAEEV